MKPRYSEKELNLFEALGFEYRMYDHVEPSVMYRMLVEHCFMENIQGDLAESVRRCINAFWQGYPFRLTPEFDGLITLS